MKFNNLYKEKASLKKFRLILWKNEECTISAITKLYIVMSYLIRFTLRRRTALIAMSPGGASTSTSWFFYISQIDCHAPLGGGAISAVCRHSVDKYFTVQLKSRRTVNFEEKYWYSEHATSNIRLNNWTDTHMNATF